MRRNSLVFLLTFYLICLLKISNGYDFFPDAYSEYEYEIKSSVVLDVIQDPDNKSEEPPKSNKWDVVGKVTIQRKDRSTLAVAFRPTKVNIGAGKLHTITERTALEEAFKINLAGNGGVVSVLFKRNEPIWSANIKRSIAYALQVNEETNDAYVVEEDGLHGFCKTDYFVNKGQVTKITKTPLLDTCTPYAGGIHTDRNYHITNPCKKIVIPNVQVSNEAEYTLSTSKHKFDSIQLDEAHIKSYATVTTFKPDGEAQTITSVLKLSNRTEHSIRHTIDVDSNMASHSTTLEYINGDLEYVRESAPIVIEITKNILNNMAKELDNKKPNFDSPYDLSAGSLFQIFEHIQVDSFRIIFDYIINLSGEENEFYATSYRTFFLETLRHTGTIDSISFIMELVKGTQLINGEKVKLISSVPFNIIEPSERIVKVCEGTLLDQDLMKKHGKVMWEVPILSFATIVYKTYSSGKMTTQTFEQYVRDFNQRFYNSKDYTEQLVYIQALGNLQLGSVGDYLEPIIKNETYPEDLRYLAMWAAMPMTGTRPEKTYELYWPIFAIDKNPLELRIAAFSILLTSNPTPGRLLSIYRVIKYEKSKHLINFYRTTILSISGSTYPCFQDLRRLLSFMIRHLPEAPEKRFWVTGNYIFDYTNKEYDTSGLVQTMLVGDEENDSLMSGYFKLSADAHGKFTNQFGVFMKFRGLSEMMQFIGTDPYKYKSLNIDKLAIILESMNFDLIPKTPFHIEFILQKEGKTILTGVYEDKDVKEVNQTEIVDMIVGLIMVKINHREITMNMPSYTKYKIPTAIGTSAEIITQNTVIDAFTIDFSPLEHFGYSDQKNYTKSIAFNYRRSENIKCGIESHNPFLGGLIHTIEREQASFAYLPIHFKIGYYSQPTRSIGFHLHDTAKSISGFSINSRTSTLTHGLVDDQLYSDVHYNYGYKNIDDVIAIEHTIDDIGGNFKIKTIKDQFINFLRPFKDSDIEVNTKVLPEAYNADYWLKYISATQLDAIHVGTDKQFQLLFETWDSKLDIILLEELHVLGAEVPGIKIIYDVKHKNITGVYELKFGFEYGEHNGNYALETYFHGTEQGSSMGVEACTTIKYNPLVFLESPNYIEFNSLFGVGYGFACPMNEIRLHIEVTQDISPLIKQTNIEHLKAEQAVCPLDLLKLKPKPYDNVCTKEDLKGFSTLSYFVLKVEWSNLPKEAKEAVEQLSTAVTSLTEVHFDFTNGFELKVHAVPKVRDRSLEIQLNQKYVKIPGIIDWLDLMPELNYDPDESLVYEYGFYQSCSVVNDRIKTFDKKMISLKDHFIAQDRKNHCSTLLLADCSEEPLFAVFIDITYPKYETFPEYNMKFYAGGHYVTLSSSHKITYIQTNETCFQLEEARYITRNDKLGYSFTQSKDGIINIEYEKMGIEMQFNGKNVIVVQAPTIFKNKLCGLCSYPKHYDEDYSTSYNYCGDYTRQTQCHQ